MHLCPLTMTVRDCCGRDRMVYVVGFTTTYAISAYQSPLMLWVRISIRARCTTLCDKVCLWLATSRWFSRGTPVSSTNKSDRHNITEILLKVAWTDYNRRLQFPSRWSKWFELSYFFGNLGWSQSVPTRGRSNCCEFLLFYVYPYFYFFHIIFYFCKALKSNLYFII